jgi:cytoskeletal protein CcmA (bactofilin family)
MFGSRKKQSGVTLIAEDAEIIGDVQFSGELYVYGRIHGNVTGRDDAAKLTLAASGVVEGEVRVANIVVDGRITGDVFARAKVELAERAVIHGNLYYALIEMQLGSRIDGQLVHTEDLPVNENNVLSLSERKANDN